MSSGSPHRRSTGALRAAADLVDRALRLHEPGPGLRAVGLDGPDHVTLGEPPLHLRVPRLGDDAAVRAGTVGAAGSVASRCGSRSPSGGAEIIVARARAVGVGADDGWPFTVPPVRQLVREGLSFSRPVTFLVGENGSGKSTIVEGLAEAYGIDVRGGHGARRYASNLAKGPLGACLRLDMAPGGRTMRGARRARGFFLRAETASGVFEHMSGLPGYGERDLRTVSHGEGFLQVIDGRFTGPGLYLMDEPESALSFTSCLRLLAALDALVDAGGQVVCATHSPLLAALPGATLLELGDFGMRTTTWDELELVAHWRRFLDRPGSYLRP